MPRRWASSRKRIKRHGKRRPAARRHRASQAAYQPSVQGLEFGGPRRKVQQHRHRLTTLIVIEQVAHQKDCEGGFARSRRADDGQLPRRQLLPCRGDPEHIAVELQPGDPSGARAEDVRGRRGTGRSLVDQRTRNGSGRQPARSRLLLPLGTDLPRQRVGHLIQHRVGTAPPPSDAHHEPGSGEQDAQHAGPLVAGIQARRRTRREVGDEPGDESRARYGAGHPPCHQAIMT